MSSHFSCIGFPVRQMSEYEALMREAAAKGERLPLPGGGMLARWEVGDGPEIWALVDAQGAVIDATPFYHIGTPLRVAVTAHGEDPDEEAEGWVEGGGGAAGGAGGGQRRRRPLLDRGGVYSP